MLSFHVGADFPGLVVCGLSATAGVLGLGGHIAIAAAETGRGIGDPRGHGYLDHGGWAVLGASGKQTHTGGTPPALSRGSRQRRLNCQAAFTIMFSGIWDGALRDDYAFADLQRGRLASVIPCRRSTVFRVDRWLDL